MRGVYRLTQLLRRLRLRYLLARAQFRVAHFPIRKTARKHGLPQPLVVTLTSYPPRFPELGKTLRSLLDQQVKADRVELWIAEEDLGALPEDIRALARHGLHIRRCRDLRSYKKLIPALEQEPGNFHVTADDDVYYPPEWLGHLVEAAQRFPNEVIATRAHVGSTLPDGSLAPYAEWELATAKEIVRDQDKFLFPTGVGGILYPPRCFDARVLDEKAFMELCPHGDDIWFFWMARLAGTRHRRIPQWFDLVAWPRTQEVALYGDNLLSDGNDRQLAAMHRRFGHVPAAMAYGRALPA